MNVSFYSKQSIANLSITLKCSAKLSSECFQKQISIVFEMIYLHYEINDFSSRPMIFAIFQDFKNATIAGIEFRVDSFIFAISFTHSRSLLLVKNKRFRRDRLNI